MRMDMPPLNLQTDGQHAVVNRHLAMPMTNEGVGLTLQSQLVHFVVFRYGCTKVDCESFLCGAMQNSNPGVCQGFFQSALATIFQAIESVAFQVSFKWPSDAMAAACLASTLSSRSANSVTFRVSKM